MSQPPDRGSVPAPAPAGLARVLRAHGLSLAVLTAIVAALPGLRIPFLSDDWVNLAAVADGIPNRTPFGHVRPLYLASLRADALLWGSSPVAFHLTNLALLAGTAALLVLLVRRYTGDAAVAGLAGILFALHPYHVECAAWIAARADLLAGFFVIAAALCYDRWRARPRFVPIAALACFAAAALSKESAVILPAFLLLVGYAIPRRRPTSKEWLFGYVPALAAATACILWLGSTSTQIVWKRLMDGVGIRWLEGLLYYGTAAVVPVHVEIMERSPAASGAVALAVSLTLLWLARAGSGSIPRGVFFSLAAFVVLLGPAAPFAFQARYMFLASAASAIAIAWLLMSCRPGPRRMVLAAICMGWIAANAWHWNAWNDAGVASTRLIDGLVRESRRPEVDEIVVANPPHRVHGVPVATEFHKAVALSGGRDVKVRRAVYVDYPDSAAEVLDTDEGPAIRREASVVEVRLLVPPGPFSRFIVLPGWKYSGKPDETVEVSDDGRLRIRIPQAPGRSAVVWTGGAIERLF